MNWKAIFSLSMFGLAMGIGTVFFISPKIEPALWLVIFIVCAYVIAKQCASKHFLHGLLLGVLNSVWITASHIVFFERYMSVHPREAAMSASMSSPKVMMALVGPVIGLVSGAVIGILAVIARRVLRQTPATADS